MFKEKKRQKKLKAPLSCDCYGLNYLDRNFQTHTKEELEQQWLDDINHLKQVLMEYEKIIEARQKEEAEAAREETEAAREETEAAREDAEAAREDAEANTDKKA